MSEPTRYLARCLDPVHVGTGGYRLGRVDMSIVRDPATGIPKIPGTSLAGAIRDYAEMAKTEDASLPEIDDVFGTAVADQGKQGAIRFYDAQIILFPVKSQLGTVWVSTHQRLSDWFRDPARASEERDENNQAEANNRTDAESGTGGSESVNLGQVRDENKVVALKGLDTDKPVNLGWLLLETETMAPDRSDSSIQLPTALNFVRRLVLVSDKLFYHLVNDNLEVRTSVRIEDTTGAASDGGLFTYEAIPRGTVIGFEVGLDSRRGNGANNDNVQRLLAKALATLKILGVGGMGTRGFGRVDVLPNDETVPTPEDTGGQAAVGGSR